MMTELATSRTIEEDLFDIVGSVARLRVPTEELTATDDLYGAGLSSLATVDLMLAIEDRFGIEFTSDWLNRRTFGSIARLRQAVQALQERAP